MVDPSDPSNPAGHSSATPIRARRARHSIRRVIGVAIAGAAIVVVVAVWAAFTPPSWWVDRHRPAPDADAIAEALESGLLSMATRVDRGGDRVRDEAEPDSDQSSSREWAVRLDEAQLNAWLATRLPAWLAHRGEPTAPTARVRARDGRLDIALRRAGDSAVISVSLRADVIDGAVRLRPTSGAIGRVPMPMMSIRSLLAPIMAKMGDGALDGVALQPVDLGDGRRIEILDVEIRRGELRLRARTSPAPR